MARFTIAVLFAVLAALASCPVAAQAIDESARAAARDLANEGGELFQQERYDEALDKLDKAYAILEVPTIGFWSGRAKERLGRWVEASERYLEVTRLELPRQSRALHEKAQRDAAAARRALTPRIPRLFIVIEGAEATEVSVTVDGAPVSSAMLAVAMPLDPGEHRVVAVRDADRIERHFTLTEGAAEKVSIVFQPKATRAPSPASSGRALVAPQPRAATEPPAATAPPSTTSAVQIGGYVALGIGGAALATGIVTGALLLVKRSSLEERCVDDECSSAEESDVNTYNALRPATTVALAVGGAGIAAGLVLLLALPDEEPGNSTSHIPVRPSIGPRWVGLDARARF